jgi:hypothetical protein
MARRARAAGLRAARARTAAARTGSCSWPPRCHSSQSGMLLFQLSIWWVEPALDQRHLAAMASFRDILTTAAVLVFVLLGAGALGVVYAATHGG